MGASILGGVSNEIKYSGTTMNGGTAWIVGGGTNVINGGGTYGGGIGGGYGNTISGSGNNHSVILGGLGNRLTTAERSAIFNGSYNLAKQIGIKICTRKISEIYTRVYRIT